MVRLNRYVLVSSGGGAEGLALVAPCIEAWKQLAPGRCARWEQDGDFCRCVYR